MLNAKDLIKLTQKKYRREMGLCIVEGEKLVREHGTRAVAVFTRENLGRDYEKITNLETPEGILAVVPIPKPTAITFPYLVLDTIQDPGNVGTLFRTAAAFGFKTVFCINCADAWSQKVIRSAMGAQFGLNIIDGFTEIPEQSTLYIADLNGKPAQKPNGKFGLVLGNEGNGVSHEIKKLPHTIVTIPMKQGTDSLNVAIAGGILMHEYFKILNT